MGVRFVFGMCLALAVGCGDAAPPEPELEPLPENYGDTLIQVGYAEGREVVDVESDGDYLYYCGGFGGGAYRLGSVSAPERLGSIGGRCQRVAIGPVLADGTRVVYAAHHGDSRWYTPYLWTSHIAADGEITLVDQIADDAILFEGIAYADGVVYAATHAGGVRMYSVDAQGVPSYVATVDGFDNAIKVHVDGGHLYVADADSGVHILRLDDVLAPKRVGFVATVDKPRDVDAHGDRMFVALGNAGVQVYDVTDRSEPVLVGTIATDGSAQAVDADDSRIAIAAWTHFMLVDAVSFEVLATERVKGPLEQDMGVALIDGHVVAAEWGEGMFVLKHQPGYVAPDVWWKRSAYTFRSDVDDANVIKFENRGQVTLSVELEVRDQPRFTIDTESLIIPPGQAAVVEVTFEANGPPANDGVLVARTNDPDQPEFEIDLRVGAANLVQVGDTLDQRFGFLDPSGANQVEALDGHVVFLAYFGVW